MDERATTSQSLPRHPPPSKTIRGDLPEAGLQLALRRARSEYWCPTPSSVRGLSNVEEMSLCTLQAGERCAAIFGVDAKALSFYNQ